MTESIPVMLYDGDCGFCKRWIEKWRHITGGKINYEPYQKEIARHPQLTHQQCKAAVQLVMPGGSFFSGAKAVFKALHFSGNYRFLFWSYLHFPFFAPMAEWFYRCIARNRMFFSKVL